MSKNHDLRQLSVDETISSSAIFILFRDSKEAVCISLPFHFSYVHKSSTTLFFLRFLLVFLFLLFLHQSLRLFYLTTVPQALRCNDISIQFEPHLRCWGWLLMVYRMCTCPAPSRSLSLYLSHLLVSIPTPTWMGGTSLTTSSVPSTNRRAARIFSPHRNKKREDKKKPSGITPVAADQSPYVKRHFLWAPLGRPARSVCVIKIDLSFFACSARPTITA